MVPPPRRRVAVERRLYNAVQTEAALAAALPGGAAPPSTQDGFVQTKFAVERTVPVSLDMTIQDPLRLAPSSVKLPHRTTSQPGDPRALGAGVQSELSVAVSPSTSNVTSHSAPVNPDGGAPGEAMRRSPPTVPPIDSCVPYPPPIGAGVQFQTPVKGAAFGTSLGAVLPVHAPDNRTMFMVAITAKPERLERGTRAARPPL